MLCPGLYIAISGDYGPQSVQRSSTKSSGFSVYFYSWLIISKVQWQSSANALVSVTLYNDFTSAWEAYMVGFITTKQNNKHRKSITSIWDEKYFVRFSLLEQSMWLILRAAECLTNWMLSGLLLAESTCVWLESIECPAKIQKIQNSFIASHQTYYDIQHRHISINYKYQYKYSNKLSWEQRELEIL